MIHRNHNEISFECDSCGYTADTREEDFNAAWYYAKEGNWKAQKVSGAWLHFCPSCEAT